MTDNNILVYLPTFAPDVTIPQKQFRETAFADYSDIIQRGSDNIHSIPWTYLDAIDSIFHVIGKNAHLVVSDFSSSQAVRNILIEHQKKINCPNYELWLGDKFEFPIIPFNIMMKSKKMNYQYIVYTSSDILWTQKDWLNTCIRILKNDDDCYICYPLVSNPTYRPDIQPRGLNGTYYVDIINNFMAVYKKDFFKELDFRYPDIFDGNYGESLISILLQALEKKQKVTDKAVCNHFNNMDRHSSIDTIKSHEIDSGKKQFLTFEKVCDILNQYLNSVNKKSHIDIIQRGIVYNDFNLNKHDLLFLKALFYKNIECYNGIKYNKYKLGELSKEIIYEGK